MYRLGDNLIKEWIDNHFEVVVLIAILLVLAGILVTAHRIDNRNALRCKSLLMYANNSHDSLIVRMKCDIPDKPQVIPIFIPIQTR